VEQSAKEMKDASVMVADTVRKMKPTTKKLVLIAVLALPLLFVFADEYPALRFRGDGQFSGGPVFGYWIRLRPIPFYQAGEHVFHLRGMPNEEMSLQLYAEGKSDDNRKELTNLSTEIEATLVEQNRRVVCQASGVVPKESDPCDCKDDCKVWTDAEIEARQQREWVLDGDADYWHENCLRMRLKPTDSYTLTLRIRNLDPKTPKINLIPTFEGGQLDMP
jgi:hypothetical protein